MLERLNTILNITNEELDQAGVFNSFINIDSSLYVDISLLEFTKIPELENSYETFKKYFENIIIIINKIKLPKDTFWTLAHKKLQFKEFKHVGLGYSKLNKNGNAIGPKLAEELLKIAKEIISEGTTDPIFFELIGLIQKNISLDRLSDMTISIVKQDLLKYTERISKELNIKTKSFNGGKYLLPFNPMSNEPIVFVPKKILRDIPIALFWTDIDNVSSQTEALRKETNDIIGQSWKDAIKSNNKNQLKNLILQDPDALKNLIETYKTKPRDSYNFQKDPKGEVIWYDLSEKAVKEFPMDFDESLNPVTDNTIRLVVNKICEQYSKLIENNGWFEFLYNDLGKLRNERFAQKLFYGIADMYCMANNLNLSRESNAGSGALDFKISKGYSTVVTVELKYSTNSNLYNGYLIQLPTYNKAEGAKYGYYLILKTTDTDTSIKKIQKEYDIATAKGEIAPEIIVVDARKNVSASRRK